jgi:hypothetical protein
MPIAFNIEELRQRFGCTTYLETGLYDPRMDVSCRKALQCGFKKLYTVELRQDWVDLGKAEFAADVESGRLTVIHDDSANLAAHIHGNADFEERTFFFLDAHVDNHLIKNYVKRCPIVEELTAIKELLRKDHVICVDDMRIMRTPFPWQEASAGNVNYEDKIRELIREINPAYQFMYLDGHVPGDVMCAYVA